MNNAATITVGLDSIMPPASAGPVTADSYLITTGSGAAWGSRRTLEQALSDAKTAQAWSHVGRNNDARAWTVESQTYDLERGKWVTLLNFKLDEFPSVGAARAFLRLG